MSRSNGPVVLYHGTDNVVAQSIRTRGLNPNVFRPKTDFGAGFYPTTVLLQEEQWANQRSRRTGARAEVLRYDVSRSTIEALLALYPWPQRLAIANCDQVLFSNPKAISGSAQPSQLFNRLERAFLMHTDAKAVAADLADGDFSPRSAAL